MSLPALTSATIVTPNRNDLKISTRKHCNHSTNPRITKIKSIDPTISWTASISRRCQSGQLGQAVSEFTRMRLSGVIPNHITFITLLSGCVDSSLEGKLLGPLVHGYVTKLSLDKNNVMVGTALVDMYAKFGSLEFARMAFDRIEEKNLVTWNTMVDGLMRNGAVDSAIKLFDEMPVRNVISWTVLMNGFIKHGHFNEALDCFREMQLSGIVPDYVTVVAVLAACANVGALSLGLWIHRFVLGREFRENVRVNNSLIDMYARCGCIDIARQVFQQMERRTLVSWNSIIVGFAVNGYAREALKYFELLQKEGLEPDGVSFTGAFTACSHAGLVDKGLQYFDIMKRIYRNFPRIEHYGCLVDLYSRAGRLEEAMEVIETMPMKPNKVVLGSLQAACRTHGDINLAKRLMEYLVELDSPTDSNYVLLANMYAAAGQWDGSGKVRRMMKGLGIQKQPGISSIEIGCINHEFVSGDRSHSNTQHIYAMLEVISFDLELHGYVPETRSRDVNEND